MAEPWGAGLGSARPPVLTRSELGQDSCPLPPSAVPNSHGGPGVTTHFPRCGAMPVCWEAPLAFCAGGVGIGARGKISSVPWVPHVSHKGMDLLAGYGKEVPSCQHIMSLPWQWLPPEYRVGNGQSSPITSAWGGMAPRGSNPSSPGVGGSRGGRDGGVGVW